MLETGIICMTPHQTSLRQTLEQAAALAKPLAEAKGLTQHPLSGLMARRQQLAMLAAMGMTRRQIRSMLNYESLLLAGVNLAATLTLGTLSGWGVCRLMAAFGVDYLSFSFPLLWFLLYAVVAMGVPLMITQICLKSFYSESLIERLQR